MTQRQDARVRQPTKLRLGRRCYSDRRNTGLLRRNDVHDDRRCQRSEPTRNVKAYTPDRDDALAHPRAACHLNRLGRGLHLSFLTYVTTTSNRFAESPTQGAVEVRSCRGESLDRNAQMLGNHMVEFLAVLT